MKYAEMLYCLSLVWIVSSCASFEQYRLLYNDKLEQSDLEGAARIIEKKNFYQKDRNKVLYYLELGALARMQGKLEESNEYLNQADYLIEDRRASLGAQGLAMVSNPRVLPYRTEYFENIAVHYLKSLNYLELNDVSAARVEARRTNIRLQELNDAVPDKPLKYHDDVLGHITMGLSYEMNGEWNDAFIAYRNAADLFIEDGKVRPYMGVNMPEQLKCDLVRLARQIGFANEESYYSRLLNPRCENEEGQGGTLALFWENGQGPIKVENILGFNLFRNSSSSELSFVNNSTGLEYDVGPEDYNRYNGFTGVNNISIALPAFRNRDYPLRSAKVTYPGGVRQLEMIEDLNEVAAQSLRDRFHRELATALLRLAAKKAVEASLRSIETKKKESKEEEKEEQKEGEEKKKEEDKEKKKEDQYSDTAGQILGGAMDILNAITERADIRSWQSLPAEIFYQRIPLKKGLNEIKVTFYNQYNQRTEEHTLTLEGQGGLIVRNLITPDARVIQPTEKTIQP